MNKQMLPQVPDYFGFLLGFLLIWLIFTGYSAVRGVFVQTQSKAIELTAKAKIATKDSVVALQSQAEELIKSNSVLVDKAKDKVDRLQLKLDSNQRVSLAPSTETKKEKNWSKEQLRKANVFINEVISTIGESIYGSTEEETEAPSPVTKEVQKTNDSLEWFQ